MAEAKTAKKEEAEEKPAEPGGVEYEDKGDHWIATTTNEDGSTTSQYLPKTQRDVPLPEAEQKKLEERIKAENEAEDARKEAAEAQPEAPPVKEDDDLVIGARGAGAKTEANA